MYKPYPKWIETPAKGRFIVQTLAEHQQYADAAPLAEGVEPQVSRETQPEPESAPELSRDGLIAAAEAKGVKIDKRWSDAKIKAALDDAG